MNYELTSAYKPTGDQPEAIAQLTEGVLQGVPAQTLLGVTGSGKTFTIANVIANINKPTKFFKQVHNSGIARINLYKKYPDSLKLVHLLPAVFTLGVALLLLGTPFCLFSFTPIILYALLVCMDSTIQNKSLTIGIYSIAAAFIQLIGYGTGFWRAWWQRCVRGKDEFEAFQKNFYK